MRSAPPHNPTPAGFIAGLEDRLRLGWVRAVMLSLGAIVYTWNYLSHPDLPGNSLRYPLGWWGWWDQGQYYRSAQELAKGAISSHHYWFPIGYPLLGALFWQVSNHIFFFPNLLCFLGILALFYLIARRMLSRLEAVALIVALGFLCGHWWVQCLVVPWNSIPTQLIGYGLVVMLLRAQPPQPAVAAGGGLVALSLLFRPGDALCFAFMVAAAALSQNSWRARLQASAASAISVLAAVGTTLYLNQRVFGSLQSPYEANEAEVGLGAHSILLKAYLLLQDSAPVFHPADPAILERFPWLLLALPGCCLMAWHVGKRSIGLGLAAACSVLLYFNYNDFWPTNVFDTGLIHYVFWLIPLGGLGAFVTLRHCLTRDRLRWSILLIATPLFIVTFVKLDELPVAAGSSELANGVSFHRENRTDGITVSVDGKLVAPRRGYFDHQLGDHGGVILLSIPQPARAISISGEPDQLRFFKLRYHFALSSFWTEALRAQFVRGH
jgi:hypothetical protein